MPPPASRIYVRKYMRADELADPSGWPGLLARIEAVAASGQQSRQQKERIGRLKELLALVRQGEATDQDWRSVVETVDAMIGEGVPPSNREVRDLLLPVIDDLPDRDDLPAGFRLVLREFDRYMATRMPPPKTTNYVPPPEVKEAARLLGGRSVILIGGARRREPQAALKKALGLKDTDLDRDQGTPVDRVVRVRDRPSRRRPDPAGDPLVQPFLRRGPAVLHPPREAPRPPAGRLRPPPGRRPGSRPGQRLAR